MADYKELLRRAVQALPENNGAARRAVYEKARAALVGQLRAINPPLPARDITTHRLQLEDCIRQVEQEASEAVIAGMQDSSSASPTKSPTTQPPKLELRPQGKPEPAPVDLPSRLPDPEPGTIEAIIAAAEEASPPPKDENKPSRAVAAVRSGRAAAKSAAAQKKETPPEPVAEAEEPPADSKVPPRNGKAGRQLPSIVARAEAAKKGGGAFTLQGEKTYESGRRGPVFEPRREGSIRLEPAASRDTGSGAAGVARLEHAMRLQTATARQPVPDQLQVIETEPVAVAAAMSAVREVEVEANIPDPQGAIDRAIATLDREARGEPIEADEANGNVVELPRPEKPVTERLPPERKRGLPGMFRDRSAGAERPVATDKPARAERKPAPPRGRRGKDAAPGETAFQRVQADNERGGVNALAIFLTVFAVLLAGVGGAGFWAYQEGYLSAVFAGGQGSTQEASTPTVDLSAIAGNPEALAPTGPGNTTVSQPALTVPEPRPTTPPVAAAAADARLTPAAPATAAVEPLALMPATEQPNARLPEAPAAQAAPSAPSEAVAALQSVDPSNVPGSQSLLLEATDGGQGGATPFSGTVEWSRGVDETGAPTLVGRASIPARNLSVDVILRRNSDATLPASHLMEVNFGVSDTFVGGSIAHLPGVLLKNQELVQGTPLIGASARVLGNSFLFALSSSAEDRAVNSGLLTDRRWIDLAMIYATGRRAIITLEKDDAADALFREVFAAWGQTATAQ